ncbi:nitrate ABC transporter permease [Stenotrophobium rhamnosiphilum]|uniref:Nitrate ABC transporter, permease protein n=1 Tax=Stenotrophobium rhamnosiphilum TaxID=2029166 RepID=A0A2T5MER2_9GAMM|nr:nitrate ABC transporter permease [Stenotrophobium rhamnosiphilum]PTU31029.1 nitrate ABC transporter, permease protein [Stenotrophobium rhamnosiphilum]
MAANLMLVKGVATSMEPKPVAKSVVAVPPPEPPARTPWADAIRGILSAVLPRVLGIIALLGLWYFAAQHSAYLPGPGKTFHSAVEVFADPFYQHGPNDQGVGWNLLASLERVAKGFGLAALIGIPLGFALGRFASLSKAASPIISLLRPVSPLAWLPIGLAIFQAANPAAIFCIFICSVWPMIINTALGVASVPQDYLNVARVLQLSEWKVFTRILLPASIPYVLTGAKLALGIAWLAIVASEMLTGGVGIGFWLWDEWNNLNMEHILIAIVVIGVVGLLMEQGMTAIANRFDYRQR